MTVRDDLPVDVRESIQKAEELRFEALAAVQAALTNTNPHDHERLVGRANRLVSEASFAWCVAMTMAHRATPYLPIKPFVIRVEDLADPREPKDSSDLEDPYAFLLEPSKEG